jgi:hypothetical protein
MAPLETIRDHIKEDLSICADSKPLKQRTVAERSTPSPDNVEYRGTRQKKIMLRWWQRSFHSYGKLNRLLSKEWDR